MHDSNAITCRQKQNRSPACFDSFLSFSDPLSMAATSRSTSALLRGTRTVLTHSDYLFCIVPQQVFAAASKVISFAMAALQKREKVVRNAQAPDDRLQIEPKAHTLSEMKQRIRELLRATPFKPFVIQTADGREYKVEHPDFVLAAGTDSPNVLLEDATGEVHFLSALLITGVSVLVAA